MNDSKKDRVVRLRLNRCRHIKSLSNENGSMVSTVKHIILWFQV